MFELVFVLIVALIIVKVLTHNIRFEAESSAQTSERELVVCRTELHDNQIFVWNKKTNAFLGQGNSVESVILMLIKNHPNKHITFFGETNE